MNSASRHWWNIFGTAVFRLCVCCCYTEVNSEGTCCTSNVPIFNLYFLSLCRYLYCGEISLRLDQATPLHKLATKYQVLGLQQGITQYMTQNLAQDSPSGHVAGWYEYALQAGDVTLRDSCLQYLAWNLSSVLQSGEWVAISSHLLMALLQRSDLVLQSEMELFAGLEAWIIQNEPDGLTAENALRAVRYAMMPPRELFRLQTHSSVLARYQESVRDLLYMSYQFHSASPMHMAKYFDVNCSLFMPRSYLSPLWGSPWIISNPTRDDRSISFQTQLGPSGHDASKRVTWNALFSPRWLPLSMRPMYTETGAMQPTRVEGGRPRIIITPATSSADFAGVNFQKTVLVMAHQEGKVVVKHVYSFHQSTEENGDFLADADLYRRTSEYLIDSSLFLHIVVKPLYQTLITTKNWPLIHACLRAFCQSCLVKYKMRKSLLLYFSYCQKTPWKDQDQKWMCSTPGTSYSSVQ